MTQMTKRAEARRAEIENTLALLGRARLLLRSQVALRLRQGCDRGMADLLGPIVQQIKEIEGAVEQARAVLGDVWAQGEASRWGDAPSIKKVQ